MSQWQVPVTRYEMNLAKRLAGKMGCSFDAAVRLLRQGVREPPARYQKDDGQAAGDALRQERGTRKSPRSLGPNLKKVIRTSTLADADADDFGLSRLSPKQINELVKGAQLDARQLQRGRGVVARVEKLAARDGGDKLATLGTLLGDRKLADALSVLAQKLAAVKRITFEEGLSQLIALAL
jgi:hypothetical protein